MTEQKTNLSLEKMETGVALPLEAAEAILDGGGHETLRPTYRLAEITVTPGTNVHIRHLGGFRCTSCGRDTKKLFDGYCFPCLRGKASADRCVMSPHLCHYMNGTCREPEWGESFCYRPHYVYLAFTDKFKVGITRAGQIPVRWVDQGATLALPLARLTSRHQAGVIEKLLSASVSDKSHWLSMLKQGNNHPDTSDFLEQASNIRQGLLESPEVTRGNILVPLPQKLDLSREIHWLEKPAVFEIGYPLADSLPQKISSLSLDKTPEVSGKIVGIKGQYLLFEHGAFNVRRHEGYVVEVSARAS